MSEDLIQFMRQHLVHEANGQTYTLPLFKFLKNEHAESLITQRSIYLGNISSYRSPALGGLISDPDEGKVSLFNSTKSDSHFTALEQSTNVQIDNAYLFCTTQNLLSDSLRWALSEQKKDTCVLIVNPIEFVRAINCSSDQLEFSGGSPCIYRGRSFDINEDFGQRVAQDSYLVSLLKDEKFSGQREFRLIWQLKRNGSVAPDSHTIQLAESPELIPIAYKGMASYFDSHKSMSGMVGVSVYDDSNCEIAGFEIEHPSTVFFPVVYGDDEKTLGFRPENFDGLFEHGYIRCQVVFSSFGPILGSVPVKDIKRIEYQYYPGARYVKGLDRVC